VNVLVCVKRVPQTGGRIVLAPDGQAIDTKYLGFTVSPHEECAVEEAVRIVEAGGGSSAVLALGPAGAEEQLRDAMAIGIERAILLETDGGEWDPVSTSAAITDAIRAQEAADGPFDLVLFGNESADSGGFQVGIRVATALGRPVVNGIKGISFRDGVALARREAPGGGWETYELPLPAVIGVKEGINLPRYPSVPGRIRAKKKEIVRVDPGDGRAGVGLSGPSMQLLRLPEEQRSEAEILGRGPDAASAVVEMLQKIGVLSA
jgi:electron transfer flavoprotein beta subunit